MTETQQPSEVTVAPAAPDAVPASVTEPIASPAPSATPVEAPVTETEAQPAEVVVETPSDAESVLGASEDAVKPEVKPEGDKKPAEVPVEEKIVPTEVTLPVYEEFKLPENFTSDKESMGEFTKLLGELEVSAGKLDHAAYQATGQKLVELGTKAIQTSIEKLNESYSQIHEGNKKARLAALKADPELGGDKFNETVSTLQRTISEYGGTKEQIAEFRKEVSDAGLDASPALCRVLFNMKQKLNKYETEAGNRIVPGSKPAPTNVKSYQQFYSGNKS